MDLFDYILKIDVKEGVIPNWDKDTEDTQINKLTEEDAVMGSKKKTRKLPLSKEDPDFQDEADTEAEDEEDIGDEDNFAPSSETDPGEEVPEDGGATEDYGGLHAEMTKDDEGELGGIDGGGGSPLGGGPDSEEIPKEENGDKEEKTSQAAQEDSHEEKQYIGKKGDTQMYLVKNEKGWQMLDAEGNVLYPTEESQDVPQTETEFVHRAIQDLEIESVSATWIQKNMVPAIEKDKIEKGEMPGVTPEGQDKPNTPEPEFKPIESKVTTFNTKINESKYSFEVIEEEGKDGVGLQKITAALNAKFQEVKAKNPSAYMDSFEASFDTLCMDVAQDLGAKFSEKPDGTKVFNFTNYQWSDPEAKEEQVEPEVEESVIPDFDKDNEETQIKKLTEVKVTFHQHEFNVELLEDTENGITIEINKMQQFNFTPQFSSMFRDKEGKVNEDNLRELAMDALASIDDKLFATLVNNK